MKGLLTITLILCGLTIFAQSMEADTSVTIKFKEMNVTINRFVLLENAAALTLIQKDNVMLSADVGETIEGQKIIVKSSLLTNITVEQLYETSLTLQNEGPHCDLLSWKHYRSPWEKLSRNKEAYFTGKEYTEAERQKFPQVTPEEMKKAALLHCGKEWNATIKQIKSVKQYPVSIGISHYYLRISGKRKDNGKMVTKTITIISPMGC